MNRIRDLACQVCGILRSEGVELTPQQVKHAARSVALDLYSSRDIEPDKQQRGKGLIACLTLALEDPDWCIQIKEVARGMISSGEMPDSASRRGC